MREISERFGLAVDPRATVEDITVGQQQRVEILKALFRNADILVLDEPTAVLTPQEARELFRIIRGLTEQGKSIIFISHKLNEVTEVADRITVLRRGKKIETLPAAGATEEGLARLMVGRDVLLRVDKQPSHPADVLLHVEDLHVFDDREIEKVRGLSLEVRAGEIVGLAGIDGNGQTELIDAMTGLRKIAAGTVTVDGKDVTQDGILDHFTAGLGHIPEDRQRRGLVLEFSIAENIALHDFRRPPDSRFGWLFPGRLLERAAKLIKSYDVRGGGPQTRAGGLSGGNQQKVVLAREIDRNPRVLIAAQPTRGLDVGAIEFVHRRLVEERDEGRGILLVSLELEEILSLSDRILVIYEGEIVGEFPPDDDGGGARRRDDRWWARARGGCSEPSRCRATGREPLPIPRGCRRCGSRCSAATTSRRRRAGCSHPCSPPCSHSSSAAWSSSSRPGRTRSRPTGPSSTARASTGSSRG